MQNRFTVSALQHGRRENPSIKEVLISALIREWQTSSILFLFDCFLVRTRQDLPVRVFGPRGRPSLQSESSSTMLAVRLYHLGRHDVPNQYSKWCSDQLQLLM